MVISFKNINYTLIIIMLFLGFMAYQALNFSAHNAQKRADKTSRQESSSHAIIERQKLGSWIYKCSTQSVNAKKSCKAHQNIRSNKNEQALQIELSLIEREGNILPRMKIIAPLGSFLPSGISVSFTDQEPFRLPFQICVHEGCFINLDLADDIVAALKRSKSLDVSYRKESRNDKVISVSLSGFAKTLDYLHADYTMK